MRKPGKKTHLNCIRSLRIMAGVLILSVLPACESGKDVRFDELARVEVITDDPSGATLTFSDGYYRRTWLELGFDGPAPPVDFRTSAVLFLAVDGETCPTLINEIKTRVDQIALRTETNTCPNLRTLMVAVRMDRPKLQEWHLDAGWLEEPILVRLPAGTSG